MEDDPTNYPDNPPTKTYPIEILIPTPIKLEEIISIHENKLFLDL